MKVLQLGKYYPPAIGGTERVIKILTETLNEFGIKTDVLCSNEKPKNEIFDFDNYKVIKTSQWFKIASTSVSPSMIFKLKKIQDYYDI
ncbi:MAG: glycosyl transferase family 1, partial [Candidatus Aenigmatarchaeota archaeon]